MTTLKLGKLAAVRSKNLSNLEVYAQGKLPAPPTTVAAPANVTWGMDLNNTLGICTLAGVDHLIAAWNADLNEHDKRPTDPQLRNSYFYLTGGQDTGLVEQDVLQRWQKYGIWGNKIAAFAPFATNDIRTHQQVIAFYRGSYLGIQCPASAQQQFANGQPWTYVAGSQVLGGHAVCGVGYNSAGILAVSWGALVEITWGFLAHYLDEAWCPISHEIVERGGDGVGIDLKTLLADIASI